MKITAETTIESILAAHPKAVSIFADRGLGQQFLTDESMLWTEMEMCKSLGPDRDLDELLSDLKSYIGLKAS